ncbi:hypothetical protein BN946_scf184501.g7 [Trametes cinnabarina]|uniref:F-box domain-containing protein n=1 Tax=Pycnoporus cinnabarinus TaxID=5643 RepID=A0A060SRB8_PYCCI|nr:hypothetical protein BN946_scf184501.g7 [Trametes cinnabarina]
MRSRAHISALPDDVILLIISYVEVEDILSLRKTSKRLLGLSKLRWVWYDAMKRHVVQKGLPIPAASLDDLKALDAEHLEARAVHAARFHDNWHSPHPVSKKTVEFSAVMYMDDALPEEGYGQSAVTHVSFLPGRNGKYLVTAVGRMLTCWEVPLGESEAYPVAEWIAARKIEQVVVNDDPKSDVVLAYVSSHPTSQGVVECRALSFDNFHGKFTCRMELRAHRQVSTPLHVLHSDYLIFGDPMHVCYLAAPTMVKPLGKSSLAEVPDNMILAVKPVNRYLLIVRQRTFEVIPAPTWRGVRAPYHSLVAASASIELEVPASSAVVVVRQVFAPSEDELPNWPHEPVTVLSRSSDGGFDTMHQYDFLPNPKAKGEEDKKDDALPVLDRLPCIFPSQYSVNIVPPSCCDLRVGPSGKGFWTETRNMVVRHAKNPARCLVGFEVGPADTENDAKEKERGKAVEPRASQVRKCQDVLYARRCNIHEILWKKYIITATALEDTVGRIAVGDVTGKVEVLDLA